MSTDQEYDTHVDMHVQRIRRCDSIKGGSPWLAAKAISHMHHDNFTQCTGGWPIAMCCMLAMTHAQRVDYGIKIRFSRGVFHLNLNASIGDAKCEDLISQLMLRLAWVLALPRAIWLHQQLLNSSINIWSGVFIYNAVH